MGKVMQVVSAGPEASRWEQLTSLAQQFSVPLPVPSDGQARAADRAQRAGQRKKQQDRLPRAHEVRLEAGFFPGATGLLLADHDVSVAATGRTCRARSWSCLP